MRVLAADLATRRPAGDAVDQKAPPPTPLLNNWRQSAATRGSPSQVLYVCVCRSVSDLVIRIN